MVEDVNKFVMQNLPHELSIIDNNNLLPATTHLQAVSTLIGKVMGLLP